MSGDIPRAVEAVRERMAAASLRAGRKTDETRLMAVSKFHDIDAVRAAYGAGVRLFGESRVQEARDKFGAFAQEAGDVELHLIGSLQRNKAKAAAELFSCVESADRLEIIDELSRRAAAAGRTLDILLELHTGEESKSGFPGFDALLLAAEAAASAPSLRLRGLMTMAPYTQETAPIRASFRALRSAFDRLKSRYPTPEFDVLSMGMTNDFEIAIEEGSTLVRVGTAIFGSRPPAGGPA